MNYNLNDIAEKSAQKSDGKKGSKNSSVKKLIGLLGEEKGLLFVAFVALIINAVCSLIGPYLMGYAIDAFVTKGIVDGLLKYSFILLGVYALAFAANFLQIRIMGKVGQGMLFKLRNLIFKKLEELPLAFFNQNKAGDLISRINSDTEKLSQFFSETLTRFVGSVFMIGGAAVFLVVINVQLGTATLIPALILWILTRFISGMVKRANEKSLSIGGMLSGEIQESLQNFKVIVSFNRRDYFRNKFAEINTENYKANVKSGVLNGIFTPAYDFAANLGQYAVLVYGIYLIANGNATLGILVSFLSYAEKFYNPLRQMAQLWSTAQVSIAAWARISTILSLTSNMAVIDSVGDDDSVIGDTSTHNNSINSNSTKGTHLLEFKNVSFGYEDQNGGIKSVLENVSFELEEGKTYALVGPTGGGKTTTASLIARLYDPNKGSVYFKGKDIRTLHPEERAVNIGFILQDPIVFAGTVLDNIAYGNSEYEQNDATNADELKLKITKTLEVQGLNNLVQMFDGGLDAPIPKNSDSMSLGQKQILAFMRAMLRKPDLLILDEATANIDTVTEKVLEQILEGLPKTTTKVIIAHRLNTIQNADVIFFVNGGNVTRAGSMQEAVDMLLKGNKTS